MFYYLYEVKNSINGKIYVGVHKTHNINDGYFGSGKVINAAIKKYGINNFTKTILEYFDNETQMFSREKEIVNEDFLARSDVYNLRKGGHGGFDYINQTINHTLRNRTISLNRDYSNSIYLANLSISVSIAKKGKPMACHRFDWTGKQHSEISKERISRSMQGKCIGDKNSQFGTCWVYRADTGPKKIKKSELQTYINLGFNSGRK